MTLFIKTYKYILLIICILVQQNSFAQDIHFSQILSTPNYINPALTGFFKGSGRGILNHRNQWSSITVPYVTTAASIDMNVQTHTNKQSFIGYGLQLYQDKAGDSEFGTTQILFNASFIKSLNTLNTQFISAGISAGIGYRQINYNNLYFDQQFDGYEFNANNLTNESFAKSTMYYPDFGFGIHWSNYYTLNINFNTGLSVSHINKPSVTFLQENDTKLYRKFILYHSTQLIVVPNKLTMTPTIVWSQQNRHHEVIIGLSSKYKMYKTNFIPKPYTLIVGVYTRANDALIGLIGFEVERLTFQFSYDVNYSKLYKASLYQGGPELSLIYIVNSFGSQKKSKIICPIF